ncbi:hypothetical protein [Chryseobacterium aureum]|uniref:hypothetical protein n=1 Tax=Chryseobacterium aureum TaxID=2497456 RepID=UPI000F882E6B|nr:hypothetical protein [Chryseobacterium aureum]
MEQSKLRRFCSLLKSLSVGTVVISAVTMVQLYWSMGTLSDRISSGCPECRFAEDALWMSLISGIFLSTVFSLFSLKKIVIKVSFEFFLLVCVWLFWNYSLFVDRESSWSTYDFNTEIQYTVSLSFFPVIFLGCLCILLLHYQKIRARFAA